MLLIVLLVIIVLVALGGLATAPWGGWHSMGYYPSGLALVLIVVLLVILF